MGEIAVSVRHNRGDVGCGRTGSRRHGKNGPRQTYGLARCYRSHNLPERICETLQNPQIEIDQFIQQVQLYNSLGFYVLLHTTKFCRALAFFFFFI